MTEVLTEGYAHRQRHTDSPFTRFRKEGLFRGGLPGLRPRTMVFSRALALLRVISCSRCDRGCSGRAWPNAKPCGPFPSAIVCRSIPVALSYDVQGAVVATREPQLGPIGADAARVGAFADAHVACKAGCEVEFRHRPGAAGGPVERPGVTRTSWPRSWPAPHGDQPCGSGRYRALVTPARAGYRAVRSGSRRTGHPLRFLNRLPRAALRRSRRRRRCRQGSVAFARSAASREGRRILHRTGSRNPVQGSTSRFTLGPAQ